MTLLPFPPVIGLAGRALSGKSTAAAHLAGFGYERIRFAGPLKAMMAALGLSPAEIDGELKETPSALLGGRTPRHAMQTIGTEWGRQLIDPDLWIRAWRQSAERVIGQGGGVVADDVRFPNEAEVIRALGGIVVRVDRRSAGSASGGWHVSEALAIEPDVVISNDGGLPDLFRALQTLPWDGTTVFKEDAVSCGRSSGDETDGLCFDVCYNKCHLAEHTAKKV